MKIKRKKLEKQIILTLEAKSIGLGNTEHIRTIFYFLPNDKKLLHEILKAIKKIVNTKIPSKISIFK